MSLGVPFAIRMEQRNLDLRMMHQCLVLFVKNQ